MRLTIKELNRMFRDVLQQPIINYKNRFGWYSAYLKNGGVVVGSNLQDLKLSIENRIK